MHPVGQWAEPVDLDLNNQSLAGSVIRLSCVSSKVAGLIDDNDDTAERGPCPFIAEFLQAAGAEIFKQEDSTSEKDSSATASKDTQKSYDLIVQYKDTAGKESNCTLGYIPFYLTLSLWPCRFDTFSHASLVVSNPNYGYAHEWKMELETHQYFGAGALVLMFIDLFKAPSPTRNQTQIKENFIKFVRNKAYTVYRATSKPEGSSGDL
jgi:hypothetical protein